jgi:hypothetical protein
MEGIGIWNKAARFFAPSKHKQIYTREEVSPKPFFDRRPQDCGIISGISNKYLQGEWFSIQYCLWFIVVGFVFMALSLQRLRLTEWLNSNQRALGPQKTLRRDPIAAPGFPKLPQSALLGYPTMTT